VHKGARSSDYVTQSIRRRCRQNGQKLETWRIATSRTSTQELTILYNMHRVMHLPHLTGHIPISGRTWRRRFWTNSTRNDGDPAVLRSYRKNGASEHGKSLDIADIARELCFTWQTTQTNTRRSSRKRVIQWHSQVNDTVRSIARRMTQRSGLTTESWSYDLHYAVKSTAGRAHSAEGLHALQGLTWPPTRCVRVLSVPVQEPGTRTD